MSVVAEIRFYLKSSELDLNGKKESLQQLGQAVHRGNARYELVRVVTTPNRGAGLALCSAKNSPPDCFPGAPHWVGTRYT